MSGFGNKLIIDAVYQGETKIADKFNKPIDVDNPLLGKTGAATVFGHQKGANKSDKVILENGFKNLFGRWISFFFRSAF